MLASPTAAADRPWSITLYGGPAIYTVFTETLNGQGRWNSGMVGVAVDRHLAYLGWGWSLMGEAQVQQFFGGGAKDFFAGTGTYSAISLGLGIENHAFPWSRSVPTSFSAYIGPSYAFDPPMAYSIPSWGSRKALLNYLGIEFAVAVPPRDDVDVVFRLFHRSGVWGIYTNDAEEVSVLGVGLRYRF